MYSSSSRSRSRSRSRTRSGVRAYWTRRSRPLGRRRRQREVTYEESIWPLPDLVGIPATVIDVDRANAVVDIGYIRPATELLPERKIVPHYTPVFAVRSGAVFSVSRSNGLIEILIDHCNGFWTVYGGLLDSTFPFDRKRRTVKRGEIIGYVGASSASELDDAPLRPLRFSVYQLTRDALAFPRPIDPMSVLHRREHAPASTVNGG
jgi:hypothetical protein